MKKVIASVLLFASVSSLAATVRITSFNYVRTSSDSFHSPLAELCGVVEGQTTVPTFVSIKVDPGTNKPASYNTLGDANGKFCMAVITYRGTAEVSVTGETLTTQALVK